MSDYYLQVEETLTRLRRIHEELNAHLYQVADDRPHIGNPVDIVRVMQAFIGNIDHEEFWVVLLDVTGQLMKFVQLYKGTVDTAEIRVAEIFRDAIIMNAHKIIVVHNHPSGIARISQDDVEITKRVHEAGKLLDIQFLDHIVITNTGFMSIREYMAEKNGSE